MASLYVHIPFCREACYYCDFHFSIDLRQKERMIHALVKEIELRKDFFEEGGLNTLYLGGGTPSVLTPKQIKSIVEKALGVFGGYEDMEITMEVNPDDLNHEYLCAIKNAGINRLSIGVQSFHDEHLKKMNRRHNAARALECIQLSRLCGFRNISIDLIYGLPDMYLEQWDNTLDLFFNAKIPHLSAYHLGFEANTIFHQQLKKNKISEVSEQDSLDQFALLTDRCEEHGYEQYEISNFARKGYYSRHNSVYWGLEPFLGIGPAAHSFTGEIRQWNPPGNQSYMLNIEKGNLFYQEENYNAETLKQDYILSAIRTQWGLNLDLIASKFGENSKNELVSKATKFIENGELVLKDNVLRLSRTGKFISDYITGALF